MLKILSPLILLLIFSNQSVVGQPLLEENFDYPEGDSLNTHNWISFYKFGKPIVVTDGSLSYAGYPSSGIGNSATIFGGIKCGESVYRNFPEQNTVYASLLVNVCYASIKGDYFFHLGETFPTKNFRGKLFVKNNCKGNLLFGVSKGSKWKVVYSPTAYSYNTTHLLILKYVSVGDSSSNDIVELYIDPLVTEPEPDTANITSVDSLSDISVGSVTLRQGNCGKYKVQVDGIRITKTWSEIVPVELTSFSASVNNNEIYLQWKTATELNNSGFEIERKSLQSGWSKIGFVPGCGTTTIPREYSFADKLLNEGKYSYRLKQIDLNGSYEYSNAIEVDYNSISGFKLAQNYPNPFNPATSIKFSFDKTTPAELKVYDVLGNEITTLFEETAEAGKIYEVDFNASALVSGVYYYKLSGNNRTEIKKMILLK